MFLVAALGDESKVTGFSRSSLLPETKKNKIGVSWCKNKRKCLKLFDLAQAWGGWAGVLPMATDVEVRGMVRELSSCFAVPALGVPRLLPHSRFSVARGRTEYAFSDWFPPNLFLFPATLV